MSNEHKPLTITPGTAGLAAQGYAPSLQVFQFCGLLWATEYNAKQAGLQNGHNAQTVNGMNTLLMAYAALEALVQETALSLYPDLYFSGKDQREFLRKGLIAKYAVLLAKDGRGGETVPSVIQEISEHRVALTHSEPHNERTAKLGNVISATDAMRFASEVRNVAGWLWRERRPGPVAAPFDGPNPFLT